MPDTAHILVAAALHRRPLNVMFVYDSPVALYEYQRNCTFRSSKEGRKRHIDNISQECISSILQHQYQTSPLSSTFFLGVSQVVETSSKPRVSKFHLQNSSPLQRGLVVPLYMKYLVLLCSAKFSPRHTRIELKRGVLNTPAVGAKSPGRCNGF